MIKVGIVAICLNQPYWSFISEMLWGLDTFFLKHPSIKDKYQTEFMVWSDIPQNPEEIQLKMAEYLVGSGKSKTSILNESSMVVLLDENQKKNIGDLIQGISKFKGKIFPTEPVEWPLPTLLRYNLFLQQEEYLNKFDYIFYIDCDMRITDWIGEEILGEGLTAAEHPMYSLMPNLCPPYEPNPNSTAYIKRPGKVVDDNGKSRFKPYYYAGGFQGGKAEDFIRAMKTMRTNTEKDFNNNYIAIWNDESHWNKYLSENPPAVVLNPSYIYPDSLIAEYYVRKVWGRNYSPKIMTLTKSFSATKEAGGEVSQMLAL